MARQTKPAAVKARRARAATGKPPSLGDIAGLPPALTGTKGPTSTAVNPRNPLTPARVKTNPQAYQRQRELKQHGYQIAVDGIWGQRSQTAWNDYLRRNKTSVVFTDKADASNQAKLTVQNVVETSGPITPEQIAQRHREQLRVAENQRKLRDARLRAQILENARMLHDQPAAASRLNLRDFTDVVADPEAKFNLYSPKGRRAGYSWLNAHGYPVRDDKPKTIHDTLVRAAKDEGRKQELRRIDVVRKQVIQRLGVQPGTRPYWWTEDEPVPTAARLTELLYSPHAGDRFRASRMMNGLMQHGITSQAVWDGVKKAELLRTARTLQPFGASKLGEFLGDPKAVSIVTLLGDIFGINDLAGMPDLSDAAIGDAAKAFGLSTETLRARLMANRATNPEIVLGGKRKDGDYVGGNTRALLNLHSEVAAIVRSTSEKDFKKKLSHYLAVDEQKFKRFQAEYAGTQLSWWGKGLEAIIEPGKWMRTAVNYDLMRGYQLYDQFNHFARGRDYVARNLTWEDSAASLGYLKKEEAPWYDGLTEKANGGLVFALELAFDPLNVARPFRYTSAMVKHGTRGTTFGGKLGGYGLVGSDLLSARADSFLGVPWGAKVAYSKGTWQKKNLLPSFAREHVAGIERSRAVEKLARQGAQKDEAEVIARERVTAMLRHGFKKKPSSIGIETREVSDPKIRAALDAATPRAERLLRSHREWGPLIQQIVDHSISLSVKADRVIPTSFAAALRANLAEKARVAASNQIGVEAAQAHFDEALLAQPDLVEQAEQIKRYRSAFAPDVDTSRTIKTQDGVDVTPATSSSKSDMTPEERAAIEAIPVEEQNRIVGDYELLLAQSEKQAYGVYLETLAKTGFYIAGGAADPDMMARSVARATSMMDDLDQSIFPVVQDIVEREADAAAKGAQKAAAKGETAAEHPLWDATGKWRGRTSPEIDEWQRLAKESFDKPTEYRNWQHDLGPVARHQAEDLIEAEIRRRLPRILAYGSRELAQETLPEGFDVAQAAAALRREVRGAWRQADQSDHYYDARETILVSDLYARNAAPIPEPNAGWLSRGRTDPAHDPLEDFFTGLSETPKFSRNGELDQRLWRISWAMGNRYGKLPGKFETIRRDSPDQFILDDARNNGLKWSEVKDEIARARQEDTNLRAAIEMHKLALSLAYDTMLSGELRKQGAIMRAWAESSSQTLQFAYRGLMSIVRGWVFLTLPFRPGWGVRNAVDNTAKAIMAGVYDPRMYFVGAKHPGSAIGSVFDLGFEKIDGMILFLDRFFGNNGEAVRHWLTIKNTIWGHGSDVLKSIFKAHAVPVNERLIEGAALNPFLRDRFAQAGRPRARLDILEADAEARGDTFLTELLKSESRNRLRRKAEEDGDWWTKFRDDTWKLFGTNPENYYRRVIYRNKVMQAEKRMREDGTFFRRVPYEVEVQRILVEEIPPGQDAMEAYEQALKERDWVNHTKAVDMNGNPQRFYHGTSRAYGDYDPEFDKNEEMLLYGRGHYNTDTTRLSSSYASVGDIMRTPDARFFHDPESAEKFIEIKMEKTGVDRKFFEVKDAPVPAQQHFILPVMDDEGYVDNLAEYITVDLEARWDDETQQATVNAVNHFRQFKEGAPDLIPVKVYDASVDDHVPLWWIQLRRTREGIGVWRYESPEEASRVGKSVTFHDPTNAANVRIQYLDVRNPLDVDGTWENNGVTEEQLRRAASVVLHKYGFSEHDEEVIDRMIRHAFSDEWARFETLRRSYGEKIQALEQANFLDDAAAAELETLRDELHWMTQNGLPLDERETYTLLQELYEEFRSSILTEQTKIDDLFKKVGERWRDEDLEDFIDASMDAQSDAEDAWEYALLNKAREYWPEQADEAQKWMEVRDLAEFEMYRAKDGIEDLQFKYQGFDEDARAARTLWKSDPDHPQAGIGLTNAALTDIVQELGFDGITHVGGRVFGGESHRVYIVYKPEQIKRGISYPAAPVKPEATTIEKRITETQLRHRDEVDELGLARAAHDEAWKTVEKYLFDYDRITVAEDNLKVFFPFVQFWRKNTALWAGEFSSKPWLSNAVIQADQERREQHKDLPKWMQRYLHVDEITDAAATIPGMEAVAQALLPSGTQYDPANLMSFSPFYRAWKNLVYGENENLPDDGKARIGWVAAMLDGLQDTGLGMSPFVRKPLESLGIANYRAWQTMYPQTSLLSALTRKFFGDEIGSDVMDWERIFTLMQGDRPSDQIAANFNYFVQQEVADQIARGETANIPRAEKVIRGWFLTQNLYGYFTGMYLRRATPEDMYLAKLQDIQITGERKLTDKELGLLKNWSIRGMDRLTWERYITLLPTIELYYATSSYDERQALLQEDPDLIRWVSNTYKGRPYSGKWLKYAQRDVDTERWSQALSIIEAVDPPYEVRQAALALFKDEGLEKFWARNDTPAQIKERMMKAAAFEYYDDLNKAYFAIPDSDFEAKQGFIDAHPELIRNWNRNNDPQDDFEAIQHASNAAARDMYFAVVGANGGKNWDAAAPILKLMPFIFEDTASADKIDLATGTWKVRGGKNWSPERQRAFLKAKPHLKWFFDVFMKEVGKKKAWNWLEANVDNSPIAKIIKEYLSQYGKHSQKSIDYMRAQRWLKLYFDLPDSEKGKWLRGDSEGAAIVRDYFAKYAKGGLTEHAQDYMAIKPLLDVYFDMPKAERRVWLNGGSAEAEKVLAYFKKYGKTHQAERAWRTLHPELANGTPEQRKRIEFWRQYFALTPDKRPAFVYANAEEYGVFIYGEFGEKERHDEQADWNRRATGGKLNQRQKEYLYVKPLLDFYFTLPKEERFVFARLNPEVQNYLDKWGSHKLSGDKDLDAKIEQYFKLIPGSSERSAFLREHPDVQDYFDSHSSPAEAALRNVLEQYFNLPVGGQRTEFVQQHPEVQVYFDNRQRERDEQAIQWEAFDNADPRFAPYLEDAQDALRAAEVIRERAKAKALDLMTGEDVGLRSRKDRRIAR